MHTILVMCISEFHPMSNRLMCVFWAKQGGVNINELFGLSQEEELMESFEVELRQTYSCNHNTLSKTQEVSCSLSPHKEASAKFLSTCNTLYLCGTQWQCAGMQSSDALWDIQHVKGRVSCADRLPGQDVHHGQAHLLRSLFWQRLLQPAPQGQADRQEAPPGRGLR